MMSILILLAVVLSVSSCNNDDNVPVDLLTLTADRLYYNNESENWVVIWNSEGELLDYKPYTLNETARFSTTPRVTDANQTFTVNVESPLATRFLNVSDKYHAFGGNGEAGTPVECFYDPRTSDYNIAYRTDEGLKHKLITDVKANDVFNLTDDDFVPYETEITIDIPSSYALMFLTGYEAGVPLSASGYNLDTYNASTSTSSIRTGYFNSIVKFNMFISLQIGSGNVTYQKLGSLPGAILWPDPTKFQVKSKDPATFAAEATQAVSFVKASWQSSTPQYATRWEVWSPQLAPKIGKLPDEFLKDHPTGAVTAADFERIAFYLGSYSYQKHFEVEIQGIIDEEFEVVTVSKYN